MVIDEIYNYSTGYIGLIIPVPKGLPEKVSVSDHTLKLKSEFHTTLVNAGAIATLIDPLNSEKIEAEIVAEFRRFIKNRPLENYKIFKKFRLVKRDSRVTVIAMTFVENLQEFFDVLKQKYSKDIPLQPTHVTMYTLQPETGIGILSDHQLEKDSKPIEINELEGVSFVVNRTI